MLRFSLPLRTASLLCQRSCLPLLMPFAQCAASFSTFDDGKPKKKVTDGYESAVPKWKKDRADKFKQKMAGGGGDRRGRSDKFKGSSFGKDDSDRGRRGDKQPFKSFDKGSTFKAAPFRKDSDKKSWSKFSKDKSSYQDNKGGKTKPSYSSKKQYGDKSFGAGKANTDAPNKSTTRFPKHNAKSEPKKPAVPVKTIHDIQAEKEAAWAEMRKGRVRSPALADAESTPAAPASSFPFKPFEAKPAGHEPMKGEALALNKRAQRQLNKQNRVFDNIQAPTQDIVEPLHTYEEPDSPRGVKSRGLNVAVIGRPNAGKSSLMNSLLGFNVSAVSAKYNTTRDRVLGVLTQGDAQIAFYDTPGLVNLKDSHTYVRSLAITASETMPSVDMSLLVVDAVKRLDDQALEALKSIAISSAKEGAPIMLVMNKMDLVGPTERPQVAKRIEVLSDMVEEAFANHAPKDDDFDDDDEEFDDEEDDDDEDDDDEDDDDFEEFDEDDLEDFDDDMDDLELEPTKYLRDNCMKVSALKEKDVAKLRKELLDLAVHRPWMFHSRMKSDRSDLELVTEIVREKLYRRFNQELPYMIEQENRGWTPFSDKSLRIDQDLWVPSDRHVKTLLGKKGDTLREIGTAARKDIEKLLGRKIHLYLNVRSRDPK